MIDAADFTPANLPFGVATRPGWGRPHVVVAIGDDAVDCHAAMCAGRTLVSPIVCRAAPSSRNRSLPGARTMRRSLMRVRGASFRSV